MIKINSKVLLNGCLKVNRAVGYNGVFPIMENILLEADQKGMMLSATNRQLTIHHQIDYNGKPTRVLLPAKMLIETLKALPSEMITLTASKGACTIKSSKGKYKLSSEDVNEFPDLPIVEGETVLINAEDLNRGVFKTKGFTSNDELRPSMTGILFKVENKELTMVATDAHRLSKVVSNGLQTDENFTCIVPKTAFEDFENDVLVTYSKSHFEMRNGNTTIINTVIDARYPDYEAVIPKDSEHEVVINRKELTSALKRISIYASSGSTQVVFDFKEGELTLSANDLDFGNEASETLRYEGDCEMKIGLNGKFTLASLSVCEDEEVRISLTSPTKAVVINENCAEYDMQSLLMPVML